jgi:hypothetical protein
MEASFVAIASSPTAFGSGVHTQTAGCCCPLDPADSTDRTAVSVVPAGTFLA